MAFNNLSVRLGDTFKFVLLLDSVGVGTSLGSVDELISKTFSNGFDVSEAGFTGTSAQQPDGLVDTSERRHIYSLTTNSTGTTNPGGIFSGSRVNDSVDQNLEWVLAGQKIDDFKAVLNNANGQRYHQLRTQRRLNQDWSCRYCSSSSCRCVSSQTCQPSHLVVVHCCP